MVVLVRVAAAGRRTGLYIPLFLFRSNTNLLTPIRSFVPALLTLKGVLPSVRHHPFERQPEQRYNTLDFAEQNRVPTGMLSPLLEALRQRGFSPLNSPYFLRRRVPKL